MTPPPPPPTFITVTPWGTPHGSLWEIAEDVFEDGTKWRDIYATNRDLIGEDPGGLRVGMRLQLPTMEIHPAYIRSVAAGLDGETAEITARLETAKGRLNAIGNFWGGDQLGTRFYKGADGKPGYEAMSALGLNGAGAFAHFYGIVAKGLRDMANRDDDTEWENNARVLSTFPDAPR
ncbi:MAG: LysM peptidoglycan-binding protein [Actinoallomurus sp.]|nr:LysM peptidoglycan-binding protein [Actinoallomurus sp.]